MHNIGSYPVLLLLNNYVCENKFQSSYINNKHSNIDLRLGKPVA